MMRAFQFRAKLTKFAKEEGAAALIVDSGRPQGLLNAGAYQQGRNPQEPETLPMVTMVHEHYGTLYRLVHSGVPVGLEMEVSNHFEDGDNNAYNVVGEIPGKTKPDEVVILGAHLDSWDLGTGATDNGAGSIAVLEAARILGALKLGQARTIRFILFGGEEQGLLGSRAYVAAHKDEMARVSGVFVIDTGTGKVRGIGTEGIKEEIPIFTDILAPLKELGVLYVNDRRQSGTDHLSFGMAGVPGFAFFQDAIEYKDKTHHTQTDTLDKILPDDLEQGAITMAVIGNSVADLPAMLPRRTQAGSAN
jgi:Zn-dependent M28 family amino/carboxypeptidase